MADDDSAAAVEEEFETIVEDGDIEKAANKRLSEIREKHPTVHIHFDARDDDVTGVVDLAIERMRQNRTSTPPQGLPRGLIRRRLRQVLDWEK